MLLKKAIEKVESSHTFRNFKENNPDFHLAHAFTVVDKIQQDWQIGYYSRTKDKVVVFHCGNDITKNPEEEVFKKPEDRVKLINLSRIKINLEEAMKVAEEIIRTKYPAEIVNKTIVIIQKLDTELYNMTLVTHTLNMINIKIDAESGKVISDNRQSILGLRKE